MAEEPAERQPFVPLGERFGSALTLANRLHRDQPRKGTTIPYISHLLAVCALVLEAGGSEDEAVAAVLHDAVEDQGGRDTLSLIRERFGLNVANVVGACSDATELPKPPPIGRRQRYLATLDQDSTPRSVLLVSAAHKVHNLESILTDHQECGDRLWGRFNLAAIEQLSYYRSLADVYCRRLSGVLADRIRQLVAQLEAIVDPGSGLRWATLAIFPDCAFAGLGDPDALAGTSLEEPTRAGWLMRLGEDGPAMVVGFCESDGQPVEVGIAGSVAVAARMEFVTDIEDLDRRGEGGWVVSGTIRCDRLVALDQRRPDDPQWSVELPLPPGNYVAEHFVTEGDAVGLRLRRM
jgi:HD domain